MKTTIKQRIVQANKLLNATYGTIIIYNVATNTQSDDSIIEVCRTLQEAKDVITGLNDEYKRIDGCGIRLYIIPQIIDADSGELVTEQNMMYYNHNSEWVKNFKKEQQKYNAISPNGNG